VWTALGLVYVLWGSTYLGIRYTIETLPPLLSAGARFGAAALLLAAWVAVRRGRTAFRATRSELLGAAGTGVLLLMGGNGLVTLALERGLPSSLAALLVASMPLWVVVVRAGTGDRPTGRTVAGVVLGFGGVAVLLLPGARPEGLAVLPAAVVVFSALLWASGSVLSTRVGQPQDRLVATAVQMAGGCAALTVAGGLRGERLDLTGISGASLLAWCYLVVFGSVVAFTAFSWLLTVAPVSQVSTYAYVNPVVAVLLGALIAGESVGAPTLLGGAVTLLAVAVVVFEEGRRRRQPVMPASPGDAPYPSPGTDDRQGRVRSSRT
jgi:drug/metabolite transporter (DMT)-like permease